jgi:WD40 repeat protein
MKYTIPLFVLLITLTACQSAPVQPVFTPSAVATATSIPLPSTDPKTVATLPGVIWSFDVSPDLNTIAFATSKGLAVYDFNTYALLRTVDKNDNVISLAWSPDGKQLAASLTRGIDELHGQVILKIWDTVTWKLISQPTFGEDLINERILDIAWSPDGTKLAVQYGRSWGDGAGSEFRRYHLPSIRVRRFRAGDILVPRWIAAGLHW